MTLREQMVEAYRARFWRWTMESLPAMTEQEWEGLYKWVASWGGSPILDMPRAIRAMRRREMN